MARRLTHNLMDIIDNKVVLAGVKAITINYAKVGPGQAGARCVWCGMVCGGCA